MPCSRAASIAGSKNNRSRRLFLVAAGLVFVYSCILGRPTLVRKALSFTDELFFFFLILLIHRAQQPRRGRPSNVFRS